MTQQEQTPQQPLSNPNYGPSKMVAGMAIGLTALTAGVAGGAINGELNGGKSTTINNYTFNNDSLGSTAGGSSANEQSPNSIALPNNTVNRIIYSADPALEAVPDPLPAVGQVETTPMGAATASPTDETTVRKSKIVIKPTSKPSPSAEATDPYGEPDAGPTDGDPSDSNPTDDPGDPVDSGDNGDPTDQATDPGDTPDPVDAPTTDPSSIPAPVEYSPATAIPSPEGPTQANFEDTYRATFGSEDAPTDQQYFKAKVEIPVGKGTKVITDAVVEYDLPTDSVYVISAGGDQQSDNGIGIEAFKSDDLDGISLYPLSDGQQPSLETSSGQLTEIAENHTQYFVDGKHNVLGQVGGVPAADDDPNGHSIEIVNGQIVID